MIRYITYAEVTVRVETGVWWADSDEAALAKAQALRPGDTVAAILARADFPAQVVGTSYVAVEDDPIAERAFRLWRAERDEWAAGGGHWRPRCPELSETRPGGRLYEKAKEALSAEGQAAPTPQGKNEMTMATRNKIAEIKALRMECPDLTLKDALDVVEGRRAHPHRYDVAPYTGPLPILSAQFAWGRIVGTDHYSPSRIEAWAHDILLSPEQVNVLLALGFGLRGGNL